MENSLWLQATKFRQATRLDTPTYKSMIFKGVKIVNADGDVKVLNTHLNGDYYQEITDEQYAVFYSKGFEQGCYVVCQSHYRRLLNIIVLSIRDEMGSRNNQKHYQYLKKCRDNLMEKYTNICKLQTH